MTATEHEKLQKDSAVFFAEQLTNARATASCLLLEGHEEAAMQWYRRSEQLALRERAERARQFSPRNQPKP